MYKYILIAVLAAVGIFIDFSILGSIGGSIIKVLFFLSLLYTLFLLWNDSGGFEQKEPTNNQDGVQHPVLQQPFIDIEPESLKPFLQTENEFSKFINDQFFVIWNYLLPHNGYVIYLKTSKEVSMLIKKMKDHLIWKDDFEIPAVLQLIDTKNGDILIENSLEPDSNLIPFYKDQDFQPRSVLGFKIIFKTSESLYFLFDADSTDFFNHDDRKIIERLNQSTISVIDALLNSKGVYQKYQSNNQQLKLARILNTALNINQAVDIFTDFVAEEFEASKLTIAFKCPGEEDKNKAEIKKAVGMEDDFKKGYKFTLEDGLNGWVIQKNKSYLLDNIDKGEYFIPRFSKDEKSNYGLKSFLSVPIRKSENAIGMVTLEHVIANQYTSTHKELLFELSNIFSGALSRWIRKK